MFLNYEMLSKVTVIWSMVKLMVIIPLTDFSEGHNFLSTMVGRSLVY